MNTRAVGAAASTCSHRTRTGELTWQLVAGRHEVYALIRAGDADEPHSTEKVRFYVK